MSLMLLMSLMSQQAPQHMMADTAPSVPPSSDPLSPLFSELCSYAVSSSLVSSAFVSSTDMGPSRITEGMPCRCPSISFESRRVEARVIEPAPSADRGDVLVKGDLAVAVEIHGAKHLLYFRLRRLPPSLRTHHDPRLRLVEHAVFVGVELVEIILHDEKGLAGDHPRG